MDFTWQVIDCFCAHVPGDGRVTMALEMRALCGGMAKEKVGLFPCQLLQRCGSANILVVWPTKFSLYVCVCTYVHH